MKSKTALGVAVLGATGSIGASTLDLVARHPDLYSVVAVTAHRSVDRLIELCRRHRPTFAVLSGVAETAGLRKRFADAGFRGELLFGAAALEDVARHAEAEIVMAAIVGAAGLSSTLAAASAGKRVLLANKEALVMAGPLLMQAVRRAHAVLLPIDSEHNAVFQCLPQGEAGRPSLRAVRRVLLTASGGPFRTLPAERLAQVTPEEACAHPNWVMGRKISVDSATMMNKGLEVIEARWLFDIPPERIEVVIHPQSIVHSLVEYIDGSVIAQLSNPDMRVPIAHALAYPERIESGAHPLDLSALGQLSFEPPDTQRFPCLQLAYQALHAGGTTPAHLNAANEMAVDAFLAGRLRFTSIADVIADVLERLPAQDPTSLDDLLEADAAARRTAAASIEHYQARAA
ncbi:MAG: 1-deoxy-D-xylulose 5-phosphate reductoisomerase [Betaproteobacteria bacterium SG8_39]|nr:MAG: 1-deoxy-D-xylulose 5-phosphate reductoisomerase [Betaproteobacteria bacterium SG8_39]